MRPFLNICVVLFVFLILVRFLAPAGDPSANDGSAVAGGASLSGSKLQSGQGAAPLSGLVAVPASVLDELTLIGQSGSSNQDLQLNRADYFLTYTKGEPCLFARMYMYSPGYGLHKVRPFFGPGPYATEVSSEPQDAVGVQSLKYGPEVVFTGRAHGKISYRWKPLYDSSRVRFSTLPFAITNLYVPSGTIIPVSGIEEKWDNGRETCYRILPPESGREHTSVEFLASEQLAVCDDESTIPDLVPEVVSSVTLLSSTRDGLAVECSVTGKGRSKDGGTARILIPSAWKDVTLLSQGEILQIQSFDEQYSRCLIKLPDDVSVLWTILVNGTIAVPKDQRERVTFGLPSTVDSSGLKRVPAYVGFRGDGPRYFSTLSQTHMEKNGFWRITDSEIISVLSKWSKHYGGCKELYVTQTPDIPLSVGVDFLTETGKQSGNLLVSKVISETDFAPSPRNNGGLLARTIAEYHLEASEGSSITFSLPKTAMVPSFLIDGSFLNVSAENGLVKKDDWTYVYTPVLSQKKVSVRYSSIVSSPGLFSSTELQMPVVSSPVLETRWTVTFPSENTVFGVESRLSSSFTEEPFFLRRLGTSLIDSVSQLSNGLREEGLSYLLPHNILTTVSEMLQGNNTVLSETFAETVGGSTEILSVSEISKEDSPAPKTVPVQPEGAIKASASSSSPAIDEYDGSDRSDYTVVLTSSFDREGADVSVRVKVADTRWLSLMWSFAFLAGLLSIAYLWTLCSGCPPLPPYAGLGLIAVTVCILDFWFPFALAGYSWSFFLILLLLAVYVIAFIIEKTVALYKARKEALKEAGTIGDLEGEEQFYATRVKRNIIPLKALFFFREVYRPPAPPAPEEDGIQFIMVEEDAKTTPTDNATDDNAGKGGDAK